MLHASRPRTPPSLARSTYNAAMALACLSTACSTALHVRSICRAAERCIWRLSLNRAGSRRYQSVSCSHLATEADRTSDARRAWRTRTAMDTSACTATAVSRVRPEGRPAAAATSAAAKAARGAATAAAKAAVALMGGGSAKEEKKEVKAAARKQIDAALGNVPAKAKGALKVDLAEASPDSLRAQLKALQEEVGSLREENELAAPGVTKGRRKEARRRGREGGGERAYGGEVGVRPKTCFRVVFTLKSTRHP